MSPIQLITHLKEQNVQLELVQDELKIMAPAGKLTAPLVEELKRNKEAIVAFLRETIRYKGYAEVVPLAERTDYDVSFQQEKEWLLFRLRADRNPFNIHVIRKFGALNRQVFAGAFQALVARHDSLRTTFAVVDGALKQRVAAGTIPAPAPEYLDLRGEKDPAGAARALSAAEDETPFDLEKGPLLRAKLLHVRDGEYWLSFTIHHVIADALSLEILDGELLLLYEALDRGLPDPLPPLKVQYKDYVAWQRKILANPEYRQYWAKQLAGELPEFRLAAGAAPNTLAPEALREIRAAADLLPLSPAARSSTLRKVYHRFLAAPGSTYRMALPQELTESLGSLATRLNTSAFIVLLSVFKATLFRVSGQRDIIVDLPINTRDHADFNQVVGWLMGGLTCRTRLGAGMRLRDLVASVQATVEESAKHKMYQIELILEAAGAPLGYYVPVQLNYVDLERNRSVQITEFAPAHFPDSRNTYFTLSCSIARFSNGLEIICTYDKARLTPPVIEGLFGEYVRDLLRAVQNPDLVLPG